MEQPLSLFKQVYEQHHNVEIGIAELKRKGFGQMDTIKALMEALAISVIQADEMVYNSLAWSD
ncbi:MAG: hypothetical protein EOO85_29995 [Pedobacter sp.]|nr:MAG: hypothetical protein EOO85_29995 [Pedobacter sp.]